MGNLNIDGLIEMASKRLGVPPEKLRSSLSDGNLSEIAGNLSENDRDLLKNEFTGCHPCVNTSVVKLRTADITDILLPALGVTPTYVELPNILPGE